MNARRSVLKKLFASVVGISGLGFLSKAESKKNISEKTVIGVEQAQNEPLMAGITKFNGLVFLSGIGAHFDGDITAHTDHVLNELEKQLIKAGSSMDKVLKVNVYLSNLAHYDKMNEVYKGRFGGKPPVRTTVATYNGVPGDSLVEIDCIAYE